MGLISNWLAGIFGKNALNAQDYIEVPLLLLHTPVSHIPVENPRQLEGRDLISERWFKASTLIQETPNMDAHQDGFDLIAKQMSGIATDILRGTDTTVNIRKHHLEFLKPNLGLFVLSIAGHRRDESASLYNVFSLRNSFCPKAGQIDQLVDKLEKMLKSIDSLKPAEPKKQKATILHVGMPREDRNYRRD